MIALPGDKSTRRPRISLPGERKVTIWDRLKELKREREQARLGEAIGTNYVPKGQNSNENPVPKHPYGAAYPIPPRPISEEEAKAKQLREAQATINPTAMLKIGEELAKDDKISYDTLLQHYKGVHNVQIHNAVLLASTVAYDKDSFMKYFKFFYEGAVT